MSLVLFRQIFVMFIMMGMGAALIYTKLLKPEDSRILSVLCIYIINPCVIINAFQIDFTPEVRSGFLYTLALYTVAIFALMLLSGVCAKLFGLDSVERASVMYSNTGNLVVPIVMAVFGSEWVIYASAGMSVQLVFMWTQGNHLMSGEKGIKWKKILTNINLIAVAFGLFLLATGLRLPALVTSALDQMSDMMGPANMIMIGMLLTGVRWKEVLTHPRTWLVAALRMLVMPVIMFLMMYVSRCYTLVPEGRTLTYIAYMALITPVATSITQLAQLHRNRPEYAGAVNALTTLMCIGTMPLMTELYMRGIGMG